MTDQLLALVTSYGIPVLSGILLLAAIGAPLPATLLLIAAGSFVAQGEMPLLQVLVVSAIAAIFGDQIGYMLGRWGGTRLLQKLKQRFGDTQLTRAEAITNRYGGASIFFSRWLVSSVGPWINLTSGAMGYPWIRFFMWDVMGEIVWVVLCVMAGRMFSDRVQYIADVMGNLTWVILGGVITIALGWFLLRSFKRGQRFSST